MHVVKYSAMLSSATISAHAFTMIVIAAGANGSLELSGTGDFQQILEEDRAFRRPKAEEPTR